MLSLQRPGGGPTVRGRALSRQQAVWLWLAQLLSTTESRPLQVRREDGGPQDRQQVTELRMQHVLGCSACFSLKVVNLPYLFLQFLVPGAWWGQVIQSRWRNRLWHLPQRRSQTGEVPLFVKFPESWTLSWRVSPKHVKQGDMTAPEKWSQSISITTWCLYAGQVIRPFSSMLVMD